MRENVRGYTFCATISLNLKPIQKDSAFISKFCNYMAGQIATLSIKKLIITEYIILLSE